MSEVALKEFFEAAIRELDRRLNEKIDAGEKRVELALTSADKAVSKAEDAANERFKLLNEFRGQSDDHAKRFVQINVIEPQMATINRSIAEIKTVVAGIEGRMIAYAGFGAIIGGAFGATIVKLFV